MLMMMISMKHNHEVAGCISSKQRSATTNNEKMAEISSDTGRIQSQLIYPPQLHALNPTTTLYRFVFEGFSWSPILQLSIQSHSHLIICDIPLRHMNRPVLPSHAKPKIQYPPNLTPTPPPPHQLSSHPSNPKTKKPGSSSNKGSNSKPKMAIFDKGTNKEEPKVEVSGSVGEGEAKRQIDEYGPSLKGQLRQLMNQNSTAKSKKVVVVPELLKNIQKNYKALKGIHHKEGKFEQKRSRQHSANTRNSKRRTVQYKRSDLPFQFQQSAHRDMTQNEAVPAKMNRVALQIDHDQGERKQIEQKLRGDQPGNSGKSNPNQKQVVELLKLFKKSFQVDELKIEKSNRQTNYNSNYSRNSSSHYNSYVHSKVADYLRARDEDNLDLQKIEELIRSQKKNIADHMCNTHQMLTARQHRSASREEQHLRGHRNHQNDRNDPYRTNEGKEDHGTNKDKGDHGTNEGKGDHGTNEGKGDHIVEQEQFILDYEPTAFNNYQPQYRQRRPLQSNQHQQLQQLQLPHLTRSHTVNLDQLALYQKFQRSKFYVQPIPAFMAIKRERHENAQLSQLGSEITPVQNNLIMEEGEMMAFQL